MDFTVDYSKLPIIDGSTAIDGNYLVEYQNDIIRIVKQDMNTVRDAITFTNKINNFIETVIHQENSNYLAIKHRKIDNITYPLEWTKLQKLSAALEVLKIQVQLVLRGYFLHDPHSFNITFDRWKPIYLDYGSINKGKVIPWQWYSIDYLKMTDYTVIGWRNIADLSLFLSFISICKVYFLKQKGYIEMLEFLLKEFQKHKKKQGKTNISIPNEVFYKRFVNLKKLVKSYLSEKSIQRLKEKKSNISKKVRHCTEVTEWTDYESSNPHTDISTERVKNYKKILECIKPKKMIDIGANKGFFSKLAIECGVNEVVAMDLDEYSIDVLRTEARENNLNIWTVCLDLMKYPEDINHFAKYGTFPTLFQRINSDFCICFALIHHICYYGNYNFWQFAERIHKFCNKILIAEFVPYDDIYLEGPVYQGKNRNWYTIDNFVKSMKKYFPKPVEIHSSTPKPRVLIKFEK